MGRSCSLRSCTVATVCLLVLPFLCGDSHAFVVGKPKMHSVALDMVQADIDIITAVALGTVATAATSVKVVQQGNVSIVERFGKFQRCLEPGLHFIIPLVDQVAKKISQREQILDIPPQKCITKDNAPLAADAVVYWKVIDPKKSFYSVEFLDLAIQNLVLTQLRSEIGKLTLDETFSAREQINSILLQDLDVETARWGVKIIRVEVVDIIPNKEILISMEMQIAAERMKRAAVIESEGEKAKTINQAEGDAQSILVEGRAEAERMEIEAEGAAKAIVILAKALNKDPSDAAKYQLAQQYIETQGELATSDNAKVILSNSDNSSDALVKALAIYSDNI